MDQDGLLFAGTIVFWAGCLIELAFLVHYLRVAPAFKSLIGVMFVLRSFGFLMAGLAITLGRIFGPAFVGGNYPGRAPITFALFVVVFLSATVTYAAFIYERYFRGKPGEPWHYPFRAHLQRLAKRRQDPPEGDETKPRTRPLRIVGSD